MVQPTPMEEDELVPDLAPLDGLPTEENYQPDDDDDLGLGSDADVGLDVDSGPLEPLEPELGDDEDERGSSWLDDGKEVPVAADDDLDADSDDEVRWTDGSEPVVSSDADAWNDELDLEDGSPAQDNGEEGFRDDGALAGFELERLPPLDDRPETEESFDSDPLAHELLEPLAAAGDDEAPRAQPSIEALSRTGRPIARLLAIGDAALIWDDGLQLAPAASGAGLVRAAEISGPLLAWAAQSLAHGGLVALATPSGLYRSEDLGGSVRAASAAGLPQPVASLAIAARGTAGRWLAAPAEGPLYASDDAGETFRLLLPEARVLRVAADGAGAIVVLGRRPDSSALALRSLDGGDTFEEVPLPVTEPERIAALQIADDGLLCVRRSPAPQLLALHDEAFRELPAGAAAPALLLREGAELAVYCWQLGSDGAQLLRATPGGKGAPERIAALPADAGAPLQLDGAHDAGVTTLFVGCERALLRVRLEREGRPR